MSSSRGFDYDQPSRDALAGINLQVSDSAPAIPPGDSISTPNKPVVPGQMERLFGLTLSVDDDNAGEKFGRTPRA